VTRQGIQAVQVAFALAVLTLFAVCAHATDLTVKCVAPTAGVDEKGNPGPLPADETITFNVYGAMQGQPLVLLTPTPLAQCLSVRHNVDPGTHCYAVSAVGTRITPTETGSYTSTKEGAQTAPKCATVAPPPIAAPGSPTDVTVTPVTVATTAYMEIQVKDGFSFLAVGTVPLGTPCDASQRVNNFNVIPASAVTWTGKIHRLAALAACSVTN
jgi:hypothetical protein